ncbi:DNA (cytosine-5-)-methyltransferase [Brevibacillus borstelensis]|uniref:DNA (cytosine-5-)-methyltransferase n=1 Tax=Brevibacillus borstelensis TaxID=45462 RepID=UPI000B0BE51A|nr:DNA (cytosine-5-)-methyltransferase [Brevibacillus borstelensis]MED1884947.1 DNA (cytosine-5-)-methyltransferase [Brevibacillus borstelensis]GED55295.1 hypothetical protein BBO01nite_45360 [Brevibacillus borstelensis]
MINDNFKNNSKQRMTFVDLFAGLGGFHLALNKLGHECVFACELDERLRKLYEKNFGIKPMGDIREISITVDIPPHDILCAGFPCQPFSKAGEQNGFDDPESGDLFFHILKILKVHKPSFFILENVANFERHNNGKTWREAKEHLEKLEYTVEIKKLSPHYFGIPQIRERVIIVGSRSGLNHFQWPEQMVDNSISIKNILDVYPSDARVLSDQVIDCLNIWQDFLDHFPKDLKLPSFPIWSMEFGATYPFENVTPYALGIKELKKYHGSHGVPLVGEDEKTLFSLLPSYARTKEEKFPKWKIQFIRQNRELYQEHKKWIDHWLPKILPFPASFQKFEWNCKGERRQLSEFILQIRASGVRVKRPTTSPSLVAMTSTQVPIIAWENRYMTPRECARLQSMEELVHLPDSNTAAYKALGNAVNVRVVELVAQSLLSLKQETMEKKIDLLTGV